METNSTIWKDLGIIAVTILCGLLLGSAALGGILYLEGIEQASLGDIGTDVNMSKSKMNIIKAGFGASQLITFIGSGAFLVYFFSKGSIAKYLKFEAINYKLLTIYGLLMISIYPIMGAIVQALQSAPLPDWALQADKGNMEILSSFLKMESWSDLLINLLIVAVFAGVGEELIFRGVLQNQLTKYLSPMLAIVIAGLVFGAFHLEVVGFLPKALMGMVMGLCYWHSQNILVPIALHTLNNGLQVFSLYMNQEKLSELTSKTSVEVGLYWSLLVFVPLAVFLGNYIIKDKNASNGPKA